MKPRHDYDLNDYQRHLFNSVSFLYWCYGERAWCTDHPETYQSAEGADRYGSQHTILRGFSATNYRHMDYPLDAPDGHSWVARKMDDSVSYPSRSRDMAFADRVFDFTSHKEMSQTIFAVYSADEVHVLLGRTVLTQKCPTYTGRFDVEVMTTVTNGEAVSYRVMVETKEE